MKLIVATLLLLFPALFVRAQDPARAAGAPDTNERLELPGARREVYKTIGEIRLTLHIFEPAGHQATDRRAAIVFFFGGGWRSGSPRQFEAQCRYLASRGMVAITADYRVSSRHQTKAAQCVEDGKSAVRWVRANAARLGVDPRRIAAGGGSAGGHVAACTGVVPGFDAEAEDMAVSSRPDALCLFNPVLVLTMVEGREPPRRVGADEVRERLGAEPEALSPYSHVRSGLPPTIVFHGMADTTVPYWTAEAFSEAMRRAGNRCELRGYEGQAHGFFNSRRGDSGDFAKTLKAMDEFLASLGWLEGAPEVDAFLARSAAGGG